ncbi:MAG: protein kinase [Pseudomonadota bacterium]
MSEHAAPGSTIPGYELEALLREHAKYELHIGRSGGQSNRVVIRLWKVVPVNFDAVAARLANITQVNVLRQLDYGRLADSGAYQVYEFLPGGSLMLRLQRGIHVQALLKVLKDIARALAAVHAQGIIHKDVKPENVLFRGDGTAVLADFGLAEVMDDTKSRSHQGTVHGTPAYMSPEQSSGGILQPSSDLYSLTVVLYQTMVGSLPFTGQDPVEIGIKHLHEPAPKLPAHLQALQGVIDRGLAKRAAQRYQSGEEFVTAVDHVREAVDDRARTLRMQPIDTLEIRALSTDMLTTPLDPSRLERSRVRRKRYHRTKMAMVALLLLGGSTGVGWYAYQNDLIPMSEVRQLLGVGQSPELLAAWSEAQSLRQDPNQGLAAIAAGLRRVLSLDPGYQPALDALAGLAVDWEDSIALALQQGNLEQAQARLTEAQVVFEDLDWLRLDIELQNRYRAERIVESTNALLTSHGFSDLPSATAAIQSFQEVLRLAPDHPAASQRLDELALHYANAAIDSAQAGDVGNALTLLERASAARAELPMLSQAREVISQATTLQAEIGDLLQQARNYRSQGQLISPSGENAAALYHRVLATDPDNVVATQGLDEVSAQVTASAIALLAAGELGAVEILAADATSAGVRDDRVSEIRSRLQQELARQDSITANLAQAQQLMAQGYLTSPQEENAVARLRSVQQLDPGNEVAKVMLEDCAQRLYDVAVEAYEFDLQDQAKQYLDLALTITPDVNAWIALRNSWDIPS